MAAVKDVVDGLDRLDDLLPFLVRLGARHVRYGVEPRHFEIVAVALIWTLESGLGEAFTPAVREAWLEVWKFIVAGMVAGMRQAQPASDGDPTSLTALRTTPGSAPLRTIAALHEGERLRSITSLPVSGVRRAVPPSSCPLNTSTSPIRRGHGGCLENLPQIGGHAVHASR